MSEHLNVFADEVRKYIEKETNEEIKEVYKLLLTQVQNADIFVDFQLKANQDVKSHINFVSKFFETYFYLDFTKDKPTDISVGETEVYGIISRLHEILEKGTV